MRLDSKDRTNEYPRQKAHHSSKFATDFETATRNSDAPHPAIGSQVDSQRQRDVLVIGRLVRGVAVADLAVGEVARPRRLRLGPRWAQPWSGPRRRARGDWFDCHRPRNLRGRRSGSESWRGYSTFPKFRCRAPGWHERRPMHPCPCEEGPSRTDSKGCELAGIC